MLTRVLVRNDAGKVLDLPLYAFAESADYYIREIDGLGPVNASIASSEYAILPGSEYLSSRGEERSISLKLGFSPYTTQSIQKLRKELYSLFMTTREVDLEFYSDDMNTVTIHGVVETHEPEIFTSVPSNSIGIVCPKPDFLELLPSNETGSTNDPIVIDYPGTVDSGFKMEVYFDSESNSVTIQTTSPVAESFTVQHPNPVEGNPLFRSGDRLIVQTIPGSKGLWRRRSGIETSLLGYKDASSSWLSLKEGVNELTIATGMDLSTYTIEYRSRYGGL